jgi:regulator of cell morphogenesis and NO signaling
VYKENQVACRLADESSVIKDDLKDVEAGISIDFAQDVASIPSCPILLTECIELILHEMIRQKRSQILYLIQNLKHSFTQEKVLIDLIEERFINATLDLILHIKRQELIIFPFIRAMSQNAARRKLFLRPPFNRIRLQIQELIQGSGMQEIHLEKISELSTAHAFSEDFIGGFNELMRQLAEFQLDIKQHFDLEQHILLPHILSLFVDGPRTSKPPKSSHEN